MREWVDAIEYALEILKIQFSQWAKRSGRRSQFRGSTGPMDLPLSRKNSFDLEFSTSFDNQLGNRPKSSHSGVGNLHLIE